MNKNSITKTGTLFAILLALTLVPGISFAKEKEKNDNHGNSDSKAKVEDRKHDKDQDDDHGKNKDLEDRGCFKAFGHFFAPGWFKHNGQFSFSEECHFPFGRHGKFKGDHSSSTPPVLDTTAPVISNVGERLGRTRVEIHWTTNENTDSAVFFSTTSPVDTLSSSTPSVTRNDHAKRHSIILSGLNASTTYYAIVRSRDSSLNTMLSTTISFTTKATSDFQPPVISSIATLIGTSTIRVNWNTNEGATSRVYYSTSSSITANASTTAFVEDTALDTSHSLTISGLTASTTYYMIVQSKDLSGNTSTSAVFSGTTSNPTPDVTAPIVTNIGLSVGTSTVGVTWITDEAATSKVFYSTTTPVDISTTTTPSLENLTLTTSHSLNITGLATSTLYHLIIQSKDASNNATTSSEFSTTTASGL